MYVFFIFLLLISVIQPKPKAELDFRSCGQEMRQGLRIQGSIIWGRLYEVGSMPHKAELELPAGRYHCEAVARSFPDWRDALARAALWRPLTARWPAADSSCQSPCGFKLWGRILVGRVLSPGEASVAKMITRGVKAPRLHSRLDQPKANGGWYQPVVGAGGVAGGGGVGAESTGRCLVS